MSKLKSMLQERFLKKEKSKVNELAEKSADGALTSFSGIFGMAKLEDSDREKLAEILKKYAPDNTSENPSGQEVDLTNDLHALIALSSEVKAISNQAAILHGERIKRAQDILKKYRDGAFTAWLLATYGNRQTPYNFLQYFEFYSTMPKTLHGKIEMMPRQAVYTLASRDAPQADKEEVVKNYQGETKDELLTRIRSLFPLNEKDKRKENVAVSAIANLERILISFQSSPLNATSAQKAKLYTLLEQLTNLIETEDQ